MTTVDDAVIIEVPNAHEVRGKLAVVEKDIIPFAIKRIYYLYDVPNDAFRGGHAHINRQSFILALSGSFEVVIDDGITKKRIGLNKPDKGLFIPKGVWREIENFSSGAVCLVLASTEFDGADYIRNYEDFISFKGL